MVMESLSEWNIWWKNKEVDKELLGNPRFTNAEMVNSLKLREIKLLIGIRRSGKSTLFYQLIEYLLKKGVKPEEILLINFEDDVLAKKQLREVIEAYQTNINADAKPYIFLDEVHRCGEWVLFLRKLYDLKKVHQVFITDSSSRFIKPEYSTVLTGRNITIKIFPLSFKEYLQWGNKLFNINLADRDDASKAKNSLFAYLKWGGFPEIFTKGPALKKILLTEYFNDIIHKDIVERYNITYSKIKLLADYLVTNSANYFSPRKYSRQFDLSLESINTYIQYFEEVFLFFFIPKFSYSIQKQQLSSKKVYVSDTGFFNNLGFRFSEDMGRAYENVVFIELKRRGKQVYYWKENCECDFLIKEGTKITNAMQVCSVLSQENKERELSGLIEAMNTFKLKEGIIINEDYEAEEKINGKKIKFMPLWKWLLL